MKKYRVKWLTPDESGECEVETDDLSLVPALVFAFYKDKIPGCPFIISKIVLKRPAQYVGRQNPPRTTPIRTPRSLAHKRMEDIEER